MWFSTNSFQLQAAGMSAVATCSTRPGRTLPIAAGKPAIHAANGGTWGSGHANSRPSHASTAAGSRPNRSASSSENCSARWGTTRNDPSSP